MNNAPCEVVAPYMERLLLCEAIVVCSMTIRF